MNVNNDMDDNLKRTGKTFRRIIFTMYNPR